MCPYQIISTLYNGSYNVFIFTGTIASRERHPDEMNGSALYHFVSEGAMKAELNAHRYIEFGKHKVWYQSGLSSRSD